MTTKTKNELLNIAIGLILGSVIMYLVMVLLGLTIYQTIVTYILFTIWNKTTINFKHFKNK